MDMEDNMATGTINVTDEVWSKVEQFAGDVITEDMSDKERDEEYWTLVCDATTELKYPHLAKRIFNNLKRQGRI
jgi:hypothetical protein